MNPNNADAYMIYYCVLLHFHLFFRAKSHIYSKRPVHI